MTKKVTPERRAKKAARRAAYSAYLRSPAWFNIRDRVIARDGKCCRRCYSSGPLHVHHLTYVRFGREHLADLVTLCESCHDALHRMFKASRKGGNNQLTIFTRKFLGDTP